MPRSYGRPARRASARLPIFAYRFGVASSPSSLARRAASARERQSSLRRMLRTCASTVLGLAVEERDLAERVRERGDRLRLAGVGRDLGERRGAGSGDGRLAGLGGQRRRPAQRRDRVVALLGRLPALEDPPAPVDGGL